MATDWETSDFQSKTESFKSWIQQRPGATINSKIQIADLRSSNAGRGIVAVEDIEDDEELFSIPLNDVLSVENSFLHGLRPDIFQHLDSWSSLVLTMIYEDGQGTDSDWWPYLSILPTEFNTLIYWSPADLVELQGSAVVDKVGKEAAEESFVTILLPIVQREWEMFGVYAESLHGAAATDTLITLAHRMATLIMAYGFDLEQEPPSEEEEEEGGSSQTAYGLNKGMVPLADLFNADGDLNNAHLLQNETSTTMIALKPIKKGQQIYNDFGQLPRSDLLRRYGYVTDRYKKWDVVEIDIDAITQAAAEHNSLSRSATQKRLQLAAEWDVLQDGYDLSQPPDDKRFNFDEDLLLTITAMLLDAEAYEMAAAADEPPDQPPASIQKTLCMVLKRIIVKRNESFPTSIAQDVALLADTSVQGRRRMAIEVRLGEKEILAIAADEVEKRLAMLLQPQDQTNNRNKTKKRKL